MIETLIAIHVVAGLAGVIVGVLYAFIEEDRKTGSRIFLLSLFGGGAAFLLVGLFFAVRWAELPMPRRRRAPIPEARVLK
jgi:hypothetical protein